MTALYSTRQNSGLQAETNTALPTSRVSVACLLIVLSILVCLTGRDGLENLFERWTQEDEYGYGFLILAVVPVLLWGRWHLIESEKARTRWPGLVILVAAQLCAVLAVLGESYFLEQIALIVSLLGIGLAVFGTPAYRLFLPLTLMLLLTVPLPYTLQAMLTIRLQLLSTDIGVAIIQLFGIPVYVEGNIIDLGTYKLQVAEACSGLRYLLPLTGISFLVAYLYKAAFWKKLFVVISAAPITIIINSFRIAVTAVLVNNYGTRMAEGFLHEFEGWIVFLLGVLFLGIEILALERFHLSRVELQPIFQRPQRMVQPRSAEPIKIAFPAIVLLCFCVGTLAATTSIASAFRSLSPPVRETFAEFPQRVDRWTAKSETDQSEATVELLKSTDAYLGDFVELPGTPPVNFFVAYYDSLSKSAAIHSPRVCLPGSGWEFASFQERNIGELIPGTSGTYNDVVIQKGEQKILMYYWFQQRQRLTANEFSMKYYLLVDGLFENRKDGALVRIYTPIIATEGDKAEAMAATRLHSFANAVWPKLPTYLPQ